MSGRWPARSAPAWLWRGSVGLLGLLCTAAPLILTQSILMPWVAHVPLSTAPYTAGVLMSALSCCLLNGVAQAIGVVYVARLYVALR